MNNYEEKTVVLVQTFEQPINSFEWEGGPKKTFRWTIDYDYGDGEAKVGSWEANHWYLVKTGKTQKQTLGNAKRKISALMRRKGYKCTFHYEEK